MTEFYDLPAEERASVMDQAERETGQSFYDLPAEERADWMNRAEDDVRGWYGSEWDY